MTWAAFSTGFMRTTGSQDPMSLYQHQRATEYFISFGLGWFLALPAFAAAGLGFALRNPQASESERGRMLIQRLAFGLVAGFFLGQILFESM